MIETIGTIQDYLTAAAVVIAGASALANLTRTESDNRLVAFFAQVVNFLALNLRRPQA